MNRWTLRVWVGVGLIVLGMLMLLERFGLFQGVTNIFWTLVFAAGAAWFLYRFATHPQSEWWAAIPGFALAGIAAEILLSDVLGGWGGFFFLSALGLGFFAVYFSGRERWWAIIPGGVLITLGLITVLANAFGIGESGGLVLVGFGLTFVLAGLLASQKWAWIPGAALLLLGFLVGTPFTGAINYVWPAALIVGGLLLILQFVRRTQ